ncbi:MAG: hypothetical protein JW913_14900 [Chitinispirillaceae bacterium]|nr:hypothetical protein [Chitinispirillaceae bacterium]
MNYELIQLQLGALFEENSILLEPFNDASRRTPSIDQTQIDAQNGIIEKYSISGKIRAPHASGRKSVPLQGAISLKRNEDGSLSIVDCEGKTSPGIWEIARGVVLSDGCIRLVCKNGRAAAHLRGTLRFSDNRSIETGGALDTEIIPDPSDPDRMYIGTLVKDAYLNIGTDLHLYGAMIWFESCTKLHEPGTPLPYFIDETDEYLFQCTQPVPLASSYLTGIVDQPVTMSVSINALDPDNVRTGLTVYPARLRVPGLGENTVLFISGPVGDQPFTIDSAGEWNAAISSSPHLHLVSSNEPTGPSLVEGVAFFIGKLEGAGFYSTRLSVSSELTNAVAFPQSKWPREMPCQRISFTISEKGAAGLDLVFNPLSIDGFSIFSAGGKGRMLHASLSGNGLSFKEGCLASRKSSTRRPRALPPFTIDNHCRVWVEVGSTPVEIGDWFSDKST